MGESAATLSIGSDGVAPAPASDLPTGTFPAIPDDQMADDVRVRWYRVYTQWRRQHPRQESVKFFRGNWNASLIWTLVMLGHYLGRPPTLTECFAKAQCARGTVRGILRAAAAKGYVELAPAPDDSRKSLIRPTDRCVAEFERMVDIFLKLSETLRGTASSVAITPFSATDETKDWYVAYARWRMEMQEAVHGSSIKFFRQSRNHTTIWTAVMHGHYTGSPPSISDCLKEIQCSPETGRNIIFRAERAGFLRLAASQKDNRKRVLLPTRRCIDEYQSMVDTLLMLGDVLQEHGQAYLRPAT